MCEMIYQPGRRRREIGTVSIVGEKKKPSKSFQIRRVCVEFYSIGYFRVFI